MKEKQKNELKVGLTVIVGLMILVYGFFILKEWSVVSEYPLTLRFETSSGLQKGDIVSVNGVKSGRVESVSVDGSSVLVRAMLHSDVSLTADAQASIQMLELMGGKKIEILQGKSVEVFNRSKILVGHVDPDIAGALSVVGQMKGDVVQLGANANQLLNNLNTLLSDQEFHAAVKSTFVNLNSTIVELRGMVAENRVNAQRITENLARMTSQLDTIAHEVRPKLNSTLENASSTLAQTDSLASEMKFLLREMRQGGGFLQKMIYDSTFTARIDSMMGRINKVLETLLDNGIKVRVRL